MRSIYTLLSRNACKLALLCSIFVAPILFAQSIDYFQAGVPVKSQSASEHSIAAEQGLYEVLIRMSGTREVEINEVIVDRAKRALSFVLQFRYDELNEPLLREEGYSSILYLSYSPKVIKDLLLESGLKFWPVNRPTTLVWMVEDNYEFGKRLVNQGSAPEMTESLSAAASVRGVPLSYPLLDLQDQFTLTAEQLWELDEVAILEASERYGADVVLIGKYTTTSSGQTWANWQFLHAGTSRVYDSRAESLDLLGISAIEPLANFLAQRYAIRVDESGLGYFSMLVHEVESYSDYRGVVDFLSGLDPVKAVEVDKMLGDILYLRIHSEAQVQQFTDVLTLGGRLNNLPSPYSKDIPAWELPDQGSVQNPLLYRWAGR